jgi:hypothetical protein
MHGHLKSESVSGYSDLSRLSSEVSHLHFRKFLSKKLVLESLKICDGVESVSLSRYAFRKCDPECMEIISRVGIDLMVSERRKGRPNLLEKNQFKKLIPKIKGSEGIV